MNEMRLVEITACHRYIRPIGNRTAPRQIRSALKPLHSTEHLRRDADLFGEDIDKMPLAQPEMRGKIASPHFARASPKNVQCGPNGSMFFSPILQSRGERVFQNAEAFGWSSGRAELFSQIVCRFSPKRLHFHMSVGEFICRNAQKTKRAARLEMHAHNVLPRLNEQWSRVRPRKNGPCKGFALSKLLDVIKS